MSIGRKLLSSLPKFNLSKTEDRLKLIILVSGFVLVFGSLTVGGVAFTMRSSFCSTCHEMTPEYKTWEASAHSNIGCVDCHIEPGLGNLIKDKLGALVQVYKHVTKSYDNPIEYPWGTKEIPNATCLKCHSSNRQYSPSGDIIIPHNRHIAAGVQCVDCHKGVSHGMIAERGVSKATTVPFDQWTSTTGAEQMVPKFARPRMDTCIQCHMKRGQTTNCTKCHSEIGVPASHKDQAAWKVSHGLSAEADINTCDKCHSYGFVDPAENKKLSVTEYARKNQFCLNCHTTRPATHGNKDDETWVGAHGAVEKSKGIQNCLACHDLKPPAQPAVTNAPASQEAKSNTGEINRMTTERPKEEMVNKVYCSQCHGSKFGGS